MQIGVTFPQNEIGADPSVIRDYVQRPRKRVTATWFVFDHVLGPSLQPSWLARYTYRICSTNLSCSLLSCGTDEAGTCNCVIILPSDRQHSSLNRQRKWTWSLVVNCALGVGVRLENQVEYDGPGMDFHTRGRAIRRAVEVYAPTVEPRDCQFIKASSIPSSRRTKSSADRRSIPIWMGGVQNRCYTGRGIGDGGSPGEAGHQMRAPLTAAWLHK